MATGAGIIVYDEETGELAYRVGAFYLNGEKIVGGWAEVYRKDKGRAPGWRCRLTNTPGGKRTDP